MEMETEQKPKGLSNVSVFIIIVLIVVFIYYFTGGQGLGKKEKPFVLDELPSSEQLELITASTLLKFPKILSEKDISSKDLSKYLQGLFVETASDIKVKSVVYDGGFTGFSIDYTTLYIVQHTFNMFHKKSGTSVPPLEGGRTEGAAFLNYEHELYFVKAEFLKIDDTKTAVKVMVINK